MTYLYFSASSLAYPHFGVQLDQALKKHEEGHKVVFSYCDGIINTCFKNFDSNPIVCVACRFGYTSTLNKFKDKLKIVNLKKSVINKFHNFIYTSIRDIKEIRYRGVNVGYSILSFYISLTRDSDFKISPSIRIYIDHLISETCSLVDAAYLLLNDINPDVICIFNGRFFESKPFFDIGMVNKIEVVINEVVGTGSRDDPFYITKFKNATPHDIPYFAKKVLKTWENSKLEEEIKYKIGESFFMNKKYGKDTGLINYTKRQQLGILPFDWDNSKKNVVIFNSSEDEFAAIGAEFETYSLFPNQIIGIKFILSSITSRDIHFYLRIHPNLDGVNFSYHTELIELKNLYKNVTIIKAHENISSYTLIDSCWKVIVFGSTIGLESFFWRKPSILLAGAMYHDLNVLHKPKNTKELIDLINEDLLIGDIKPAIMFGYHIMDRNISNYRPKYISLYLREYSFLGKKFRQPEYQLFLGSHFLFKIINLILLKLVSKLYRIKN